MPDLSTPQSLAAAALATARAAKALVAANPQAPANATVIPGAQGSGPAPVGPGGA